MVRTDLQVRRRLGVFAAVLLLAAVACGKSASDRCEESCKREADCFERVGDLANVPEVDTSECVTMCSQLERHPEGPSLVAAHVACVREAPDCVAVLQCQ